MKELDSHLDCECMRSLLERNLVECSMVCCISGDVTVGTYDEWHALKAERVNAEFSKLSLIKVAKFASERK